MTLKAVELIGAIAPVLAHGLLHVPVGAGLRKVAVDIRAPAKVLPIVSVHTKLLVVRAQVERTPHRLVVEQIKVQVELVVMNELSFHFIFAVGEGTVFTSINYILPYWHSSRWSG